MEPLSKAKPTLQGVAKPKLADDSAAVQTAEGLSAPKKAAPRPKSTPEVTPESKSTPSTPEIKSKSQSTSRRPVLIGVAALAGILVLGGLGWLVVGLFKSKTPTTSAAVLSPDEQELITLTNQARSANGLPPLKMDPALCEVAKSISTQWAAQGLKYKFNKEDVEMEVRLKGYPMQMFGRNGINVNAQPMSDTLRMLSDNELARKKMLNPQFEEIGVAIVFNETQKMYYVTQFFGLKAK